MLKNPLINKNNYPENYDHVNIYKYMTILYTNFYFINQHLDFNYLSSEFKELNPC